MSWKCAYFFNGSSKEVRWRLHGQAKGKLLAVPRRRQFEGQARVLPYLKESNNHRMLKFVHGYTLISFQSDMV